MRKIRRKLFLIIIIFFIFCFIGRIKTLYSSYQTYKFYKNEISRLKNENKILKEKIEKIKNDPYYIEKILREEYGMIKDGELVIKMED